ncbi:unnamed protein product [Urochloa humidicola]
MAWAWRRLHWRAGGREFHVFFVPTTRRAARFTLALLPLPISPTPIKQDTQPKPKPNNQRSHQSSCNNSKGKGSGSSSSSSPEMAAAASGGTGGAWPAATSRFAAACGALSQYVKAAEAERAPARRPLPLMPGADVDGGGEDLAAAGAQMTIVYGERVLVLDAVPADTAAGLLRLATAAAGAADADLPVARKASLQRFMEKRKVRAAARGAPYSRPDGGDAVTEEDHLNLAL